MTPEPGANATVTEAVLEPLDESELSIGNRQFSSRYFLAPLAGYTHLAFRLALRELGGLGLATTDLVQASQLLSNHRRSRQLIATSSADQPLSVQIFSGRRPELIRAASWLEDHGYAGVDINMGCPMAKITGQGGGARLMCDTEQARGTVAQVVSAVSIPVSVKMRLGWDRNQITAPELARQLEDVGVAAVTVHGRTREQGFHGAVHLEAIQATVEAVHSIPVIGNGDVRSIADAWRMRRLTGCAAVAIGRGAMLDPWIFQKLSAAGQGAAPIAPTAEHQIQFLARHFDLMVAQHGVYSCVLFRKFAAWYGAKLGIPIDLENRLRRFESLSEFQDILEQIRERHNECRPEIATALIKTPNGPVERW
ncbi:MAG: tRNA-dihydrouridine synthase [Planctomycetaceae bacterium]